MLCHVYLYVYNVYLYSVWLYMFLKQKFIFSYTMSCQTITTLFLDIITTMCPRFRRGGDSPSQFKIFGPIVL